MRNPTTIRRGRRIASCPMALAGLASALAVALTAQLDLAAQDTPEAIDLATMFELGNLVLDTNGDSVPDLVNASLVLGASPSVAATAAAAEIAARLGFETMAMDLPIARGPAGDAVPIVIGRAGLTGSGLTSPGVDPTSLDAGEGVVAIREVDGRTWILVLGGDDDGLLAAARLFAGVLPHTRTLSTADLSRVRDDLADALEVGGIENARIRLTQARARAGQDGVARLVVDVSAESSDVDSVAAALRTLADGSAASGTASDPDTSTVDVSTDAERDAGAGEDDDSPSGTPLAYPGLGSVEARILGGPTIRMEGRAEPDRPGPISGRPGSGAKDELDLSSVYTTDGLLGGGLIPDRIDVKLVPGDAGVTGLPELAGRLGLESTGLIIPLVEPASRIERPNSQPTMVLAGIENSLTDQLADSGLIDVESLGVGEGLIQFVPDAFGSKPAFVITGSDDTGARRALEQVALTFPNLSARGKDRPTVDDVERELWDVLAGYAPIGQAATGLYKLDRIGRILADSGVTSASVLMSVEKADPGLAEVVRSRAATALGLQDVGVTIDDRDVQNAAVLFEQQMTLPSEVARFWQLLRSSVVPAASGQTIRLEARLSEPPALRAQIAAQARQELVDAGAASGSQVTVLSAFKQGFSWLEEVVAPALQGREVGEVVIRFRRNDPPEEWPQQAIHTPLRWLHEIFPIDEVLARDLGLELDQIRFEQVTSGPTYAIEVNDARGAAFFASTFEPKWVLRPYFDRFQDYEHVRVTTGWLNATSDRGTIVDERIVTDPEAFWDHYQSTVLPAIYDHVMDLHDGLPQGGSADAPYFGELRVEMSMSEPDYRLGIDNEIHAPMDALHEEIYFGTIEFLDVLGRNSRGQGLTFPGRIIPIMRPKQDGSAATLDISVTGFATSRPAVVVTYEDASGDSAQVRLDIPKTSLERPSARMAKMQDGVPGLTHLGLRVRVDTDADVRDSLLIYGTARQVDRTMVSAEQIESMMTEIEGLRAAGLYTSALAYDGLGSIEVWAEWTHEQDPDSRRIGALAANGTPAAPPDWRALLPNDFNYAGDRIVQWDTPIPPPEGHEMLAKLGDAFPEASVYRVGQSYLGKDVWAMDLQPAIGATHWSHAKATTFKPTVVYSARQHANEVSSTSHVLRHAELLLTDPEQRRKLDKVNVIIHPFTNADGAQLAYDLYNITPDYILHAGYLGSLGQDATSGGNDDHPIYPESTIRGRLWSMWLPDVFLNPHGYPSHQVVQLFSEYTGLVRRGRVTERNWGFNKGWFMPGFGYIDSPEYPRHKDAAFEIRDYITRGINSNRDVFDLNQRTYGRYERYGAQFDPDVFRLPMTDSVLIQMPLKGSSGGGGGRGGYNPRITIWSGTTEAPDETAYGPYMELVAKAGLSWDQAILDYLYEADHEVERSGRRFFGGVSIRMNRPRPAEKDDEDEEEAGERIIS